MLAFLTAITCVLLWSARFPKPEVELQLFIKHIATLDGR